MIYIYEAVFHPEKSGGFTVFFRDLDQATCGADYKDSVYMAVDLLETYIGYLVGNGMNVPKATFGHHLEDGEKSVTVAARIDTDDAVDWWGYISTAEAARILGCTPGHVRNLALKGELRSRKDGRDLKVRNIDVQDRAKAEIKPGPKPKQRALA